MLNTTITSKTVQPVQWTGDNPKRFLDGVILDDYKAVISGYFAKDSLGKRLKFTAGVNTITNINLLDNEDFTQTWNPGEQIKIPQSAANGVTLTLLAVTPKVLYVSNALTSEVPQAGIIVGATVTEPLEYCDIHLMSEVSFPEFFYNLISANESENYISKIDPTAIQKFYVNNFNPADEETQNPLLIGSPSFAWYTGALTAPNISASYIVGGGWANTGTGSDYRQYFTITHLFSQHSLMGKDILTYLQTLTPPSIYPLTYICKVNGKYDQSNNVYNTVRSLTPTGIGAWFNQNGAATIPEYTLGAISYTDVNGNSLPALDFSQNCGVTILINSASGLFVEIEEEGTQFILSHFYVPKNASQYQNTQTKLSQNLLIDAVKMKLGQAEQNGIEYGTPYQVFKNVLVTQISANQVSITFTVEYSAQTIALLQAQPNTNRNYCLCVTTEKFSEFGNNIPDRVCVVCDVNNMVYDQSNTELLGLIDSVNVYAFPDDCKKPYQAITGYEGDLFLSKFAFWLETNVVNNIQPILKTVSMRVVAVKQGKTDFIVEKYDINVTSACISGGVQSPSISQVKGYVMAQNDTFNTISLQRLPAKDKGTKLAFQFAYPLILRYDYWNAIQTTNPGGITCNNDINNDIENVNNAWSNLIQNGWNLVLRFYAEVVGYVDLLQYHRPMFQLLV